MSAFALPIPPAALTGCLLRPTERSPTTAQRIATCAIRSFGYLLEPRYIFRAGRLDQ